MGSRLTGTGWGWTSSAWTLTDAVTGVVTTLSNTYRSTTLAFDNVSGSAIYADGTLAVLVGTTLSSALPAQSIESGTIEGHTYVDAVINGITADPGIAPDQNTTLEEKQDVNLRKYRGQGFDFRTSASFEAISGDPASLVELPVTPASPTTLVKGVSGPNTDDNSATIIDYGVVTFVNTLPTNADDARPAMANPDKSVPFRTSDIVLPTTLVNSLVGLPTYSEIIDGINYPQPIMDTNLSATRNMNIGPGTYGGYMFDRFAWALLWLIFGGGTEAQRYEVARAICQQAEEIKWRLLQGGAVTSNGGWCQYYELLRGAAMLLPGHFDSVLALTIETTDRGDLIWPPQYAPVLAEVRRVEPCTQDIIDINPLYISSPFNQDQLGELLWCSQFGSNAGLPTGGSNQLDELENILQPGSYSLASDDKPSYRHITMQGMVALTLFLRLTSSSQIAANQQYFNYVDHHMNTLIEFHGTYDAPGYASAALEDWVYDAWVAFRGTDGLYTWTPAASLPDFTLVDETGSTPTDWPALRVSIDSGAWQTLTAAGLTLGSFDNVTKEIEITGLTGTETSVRFHLEHEQPGEPFNADGSVDAVYYVANGTGAVNPDNSALPGLPIAATVKDEPIEAIT